MEISFFILIWTFLVALSKQVLAEFDNDPDIEADLVNPPVTYLAKLPTESGPMKKIPGTNLFSGIYFRTTKKTPSGGILTYIHQLTEGFHMVQVDGDPDRAYRYEEGKDWYGTDQWMFKEVQDFPGWYELHNRHFPDGLTAVSSWKVGGGFHVLVTEQNDPKFGVKGSNRDFALWKPIGVNGSFFQLKNKQFPEGFVANTTNGIFPKLFFIQIDTDPKHAESLGECGYLYYDTWFSISSYPKFVLNAKIDDFEFSKIPANVSQYKKTSTKKINFKSETIAGNKTSYKIAHVYFDASELTCVVEGRFQDFNETSVKFDVPAMGDFSARSEPERLLSANGSLAVTETKESKVMMDVEVPTSRFVNFLVHSEWYDDVPFPFEATMKIRGSLSDGTILSSEFIGSNLPVDWRNSEGNAADENTWQIKVNGKLLLSFAKQREILTQLSVLPILE